MTKSSIPQRKTPGNGKGTTFRRFFKHWRNGKVYDAWDYGHKCWPIGGRSR